MLFKEFHNAQLSMNGVTPHHRKPMIGNSDGTKKHLNTVAARYKKDNTKNHKIEMLKTKPGRFHCDPKDLQYIQQTFLKGRMPTIHEMKILGGKCVRACASAWVRQQESVSECVGQAARKCE